MTDQLKVVARPVLTERGRIIRTTADSPFVLGKSGDPKRRIPTPLFALSPIRLFAYLLNCHSHGAMLLARRVEAPAILFCPHPPFLGETRNGIRRPTVQAFHRLWPHI